MKKVTKAIGLTLVAASLLVSAACSKTEAQALDSKKITIGVTGGPHQQIADQVKKLAKKDGIDITVKVFNDYNTPNTALDQHDLDSNNYQTLPFLKQQVEDKSYKITDVFKTVAFPMGIYANSLKNVSEHKKGNKITVKNDTKLQYLTTPAPITAR